MIDSQLSKADLHMHSATGDGLSTIEEMLEYVEVHTDLAVIGVTDHDDTAGALRARDLCARDHFRFEVVVGSEVTTLNGHLLVYGVESRLPMFRSLRSTCRLAHAQGGVCVVPHPLSWLTLSVGQSLLDSLARARSSTDANAAIDGIELFNPSFAGRVRHERARALNRVWRFAETGGSDAHQAQRIGTAWTEFPGQTAADLFAAMRAGTTRARGRFWTLAEHREGLWRQQWRSLFVEPARKLARLAPENIRRSRGQGRPTRAGHDSPYLGRR